MNRIAPPPPTIALSQSLAAPSYQAEIATLLGDRARGVDRWPHATFAPMHYEPGYAYPLVVWLHGAADNERQLNRVMPAVSMRNYVALGPRGTVPGRTSRSTYCWRQSEDDIEQAETRILQCIEIAQDRFNIHAGRIFLAGFGGGGSMAVRVAWNQPTRFAGVATLGGALPRDHQPLRHVNSLRHLPCFIAASRQSRQYPEHSVCRDLRLLHSVGCTVDLRQYPGGDELCTNMLSDLDRWMMDIVCGSGC